MAMEPMIQLALLITPSVIILVWITDRFTIYMEFDICELTRSKRSPESVLSMLRAIINSGSGRIDFLVAHVCSLFT